MMPRRCISFLAAVGLLVGGVVQAAELPSTAPADGQPVTRLAVSQRQQIYADLCVAEYNATHPFFEAVQRGGAEPPGRDAALAAAQTAVQDRYGLTRNEYLSIMAEGVAAHWSQQPSSAPATQPSTTWYTAQLLAGSHLAIGNKHYRDELRTYLAGLSADSRKAWLDAAVDLTGDPRAFLQACRDALAAQKAAPAAEHGRPPFSPTDGVEFSAPRELQAWEAIGNLSPDPTQRQLARTTWLTLAEAGFQAFEARRLTGNGTTRPAIPPRFPAWATASTTSSRGG